MRWLAGLREEISARNQNIAALNGVMHDITASDIPSVIFAPTENRQHGNFHPISYRNICANPDWTRRLAKAHTGWRSALSSKSWRWRELDCANSSDALLMNIFCYRHTVSNPVLSSMLGVSPGLVPQFGFRPRIPLRNGTADRTEIDLKLGDLMIEAKLTEGNFQSADMRLIARYRDIEEVFDIKDLVTQDLVTQDLITKGLITNGDTVHNYQLIRGVLAAFATGGSFCVLCDARRPDLIDNWYSVIKAVRNYELRGRLKLLTWQELTVALPETLRKFLAVKYGIAGNR